MIVLITMDPLQRGSDNDRLSKCPTVMVVSTSSITPNSFKQTCLLCSLAKIPKKSHRILQQLPALNKRKARQKKERERERELEMDFFPRLPSGQYGPVSQLSRLEKSCTGSFNWGEAHCAGENVKRRTEPFQERARDGEEKVMMMTMTV